MKKKEQKPNGKGSKNTKKENFMNWLKKLLKKKEDDHDILIIVLDGIEIKTLKRTRVEIEQLWNNDIDIEEFKQYIDVPCEYIEKSYSFNVCDINEHIKLLLFFKTYKKSEQYRLLKEIHSLLKHNNVSSYYLFAPESAIYPFVILKFTKEINKMVTLEIMVYGDDGDLSLYRAVNYLIYNMQLKNKYDAKFEIILRAGAEIECKIYP